MTALDPSVDPHDLFPTDTAGRAAAAPPESMGLGDAHRVQLRIAPVANRRPSFSTRTAAREERADG